MMDGAQSAVSAPDAKGSAGHGAKTGGGPLRALYAYVLKLAGGKYAEPALFAVSFAESSFFPIPPDVMLMPMVLAKPQRGLRYALICTVGSIFGALLGYYIGVLLFPTVGKAIIGFFGYAGKEEALRASYGGSASDFLSPAFWVILIKGLTPIPFKLVTIVSGAAGMNILAFLTACTITRGFRFLVEAWVFKTFGPTLAPVIEKRIGLFMLAAAVIIIGGFAAVSMLHL